MNAVALAQIDLGGQRDVAVERGGELIIHLEVGVQVLPAVGVADVSARGPQKRRRRSQRQPDAFLVRGQELVADDPRQVSVVTPSADAQMRREQDVEVEFFEQLRVALEPRVDQQRRLMRIGDDFLEQMIAAVGRVADDLHAESGVADVLGGGVEIAAFLVEESLAVGDEKLEVADLRLIDRRKINLVQDAGRGREPQPARRRIRRANCVLGAAGPSRRDAGGAGGDGRCLDSCHRASVRFDPRSDYFGLRWFRSGRA